MDGTAAVVVRGITLDVNGEESQYAGGCNILKTIVLGFLSANSNGSHLLLQAGNECTFTTRIIQYSRVYCILHTKCHLYFPVIIVSETKQRQRYEYARVSRLVAVHLLLCTVYRHDLLCELMWWCSILVATCSWRNTLRAVQHTNLA